MGKAKLWKLVGILGLIVGLAAIPFTTCAAPAPAPMKLTLAHVEPPGSVPAQFVKWWANEVEKRTSGEVVITIYGAGTLATHKEMLEATTKGTIDIGYTTWLTHFANNFPIHQMKVGAVAFRNKSLALWMAGDAIEEEIPEMRTSWQANKLMRLFSHGVASVHLLSKKPIRTLEDAKGLKVRASGILNTTLLQAIDAVVVNIPSAEAFDALQKGVIQGTVCDISWAARFKFPEVAKCFTHVGFGGDPTLSFAMNLEVWNKLSPKIQKVFLDLRTESLKVYAEMLKKDIQTGAFETFKKGNVEIIDLPAADIERWKSFPNVKNLGENWVKWGLKNAKIAEPRLREILQRYISLIEEMEKRYPESW